MTKLEKVILYCLLGAALVEMTGDVIPFIKGLL